MEAEVANFDKILSIMSTFGKHIQKLNQIIISTELHHFSLFRAIFAFLSTHPVHFISFSFSISISPSTNNLRLCYIETWH